MINVSFKNDPLLWWKICADSYLRGSYESSIYEYWKLEEFRRFLHFRPLTPEDVNYFLNNRIKEIKKTDLEGSSARIVSKSPVLFEIRLGKTDSNRESQINLAHEIVHLFYRFRGEWGNYRQNPSERLVETEAIRFYRKNKDFLDSYLARV